MKPEVFQKNFIDLFSDVFKGMEEKEVLIAQKGKEKLNLKVYNNKGETSLPLEKVTLMLLEKGWVRNIKDRNSVDECEFIVATFRPLTDIPLPIFAMEASFHYGKYDHLNTDLFPLSADSRYREIFCEPVKKLRLKHDGLDGLLPGVRNPMLGDYTSGGMLAGDFAESKREVTLPWLLEYSSLYLGFLKDAGNIPILKDKAVVDEGRKAGEMFLSMFKKATPHILSDIPNLYSEEAGKNLGELLF